MKIKNIRNIIKIPAQLFHGKLSPILAQVKKYIYVVVGYLQTSETIFLLFFANVIGLGAGFAAILFRWMIAFFQQIFFTQGRHALFFMGNYYVILVPAAGGIVVGLMIYFLAKEAKGHGVPEVMFAVATTGSKIRPRVAAIKAIVSSICIGSGGSAGREGPIVQISSAMGSTLGQVFRLAEDKKRILIACGAAGGIAATFNAPLAGIFFGLEVILREYGTRYFSSVVLSAVTATVISRTFLGSRPAFITPPYELLSSWDILFYFILGILAALVGWVFIKTLYKCEDLFDAMKIPTYLKPALGGLILGIIGFFFPQIFGVGYPSIEVTLTGHMAPFLVFALIGLKLIATSLTLGSGGSGGVFAPSLFIGSMLGSSFGSFLHLIFPGIAISPGAYALVGMAAVFAGAAQAPITAILILFEMTSDYKIMLPLMVAGVISTLVVRWMSKDSIYTLKLTRRGIDILKDKNEDILYKVKVYEAMFSKIITIRESTSVHDALDLLEASTHRGLPVLDDNGLLTGILTHHDIITAIANGKKDEEVSGIMTRDLVLCFPEDSLTDALRKLGEKNIGRIPVVSHNDHYHLLGLITRKGIIEAYNRELHRINK